MIKFKNILLIAFFITLFSCNNYDYKDGYNFIYDQIVSIGELVSSKMLYHSCKKAGINVGWLDVRDVLVTDNTYREAKVIWKDTNQRMNDKVRSLFEKFDCIITQ